MPAPKDPVARELWKKRMSEARKGEKNVWFGKTLPDEMKKKISQTRIERGVAKGEKNPFYGKNHSEQTIEFLKNREVTDEQRRRISEATLGRQAWNKGIPSTWTKGIPRTEETKRKISESTTGKPKARSAIEKLRATKLATTPTGADSPNWKGGITKLNLHIRVLPRYKNICAELMREVDYTDHFTGNRGGVLACHHIIPQNVIIRMYNIKTIDDARNCPLLFDKHNMVVMLSSAHDKFHNLYGDGKNIYELTDAEIQELYN